jgi:hypothetical protein
MWQLQNKTGTITNRKIDRRNRCLSHLKCENKIKQEEEMFYTTTIAHVVI